MKLGQGHSVLTQFADLFFIQCRRAGADALVHQAVEPYGSTGTAVRPGQRQLLLVNQRYQNSLLKVANTPAAGRLGSIFSGVFQQGISNSPARRMA